MSAGHATEPLERPTALKFVESLLVTLWAMFGWFAIFLGLAFVFQRLRIEMATVPMLALAIVLAILLGYGSVKFVRYVWGSL